MSTSVPRLTRPTCKLKKIWWYRWWFSSSICGRNIINMMNDKWNQNICSLPPLHCDFYSKLLLTNYCKCNQFQFNSPYELHSFLPISYGSCWITKPKWCFWVEQRIRVGKKFHSFFSPRIMYSHCFLTKRIYGCLDTPTIKLWNCS